MTAEHNRALVERLTGHRLRAEFNDMLPPSWMNSTLELLLNAARAEGPRPSPRAAASICFAYQQSDEMACSCGMRWDVNDPDPPKCPRLG